MKISLNLILVLVLGVGWIGTACKKTSPNPEIKVPPVGIDSSETRQILDTVEVFSNSMSKEVAVTVVLPSNYNDRSVNKYPVIYLLHGAFGGHLDWIKSAPLESLADQYGFIFICPNGHPFGWYLDSPVDTNFRYEEFMTEELVPWVAQNYRGHTEPEKRAICGLSMGGHGAFYLSFRHQDIWGVCGAISGGMDLRPFPDNWELTKRLGKLDSDKGNWLKYSVVGQLDSLNNQHPKIYFDCGESDFFIDVNAALHDSLTRRGIEHIYKTRPGAHDWDYFAASLPDQLEFFAEEMGR
ncbi:MAG: esterase family protein [Bacteroidia bacterium]|nr:esterase family protein [Bacteroidia bacterium]